MKKSLFMASLALVANFAVAQFKPVDQGSSLQFTVKNFGFEVAGTFKGLDGNIIFDPANAASAVFDVTIDASTVNTDNSLRDGHLRDDSYFDVKHYPRIHFVSTEVRGKNGAYKITGKLTIKKTTKVISFPFDAQMSGDGYLFKGSFTINRKDFDIGGTSTISNELTVALNITAKKS
ncbi:MAG TPA: YceI family protein [Mucilaginibacter sp.]|jgi:polyisoprenoid-binding protein YceI|nr:YceI family protein [Mucilaginibacter sp.]